MSATRASEPASPDSGLALQSGKRSRERIVSVLVKEPESRLVDAGMISQRVVGGVEGNRRGARQRIAVHASRYRRKRDAPAVVGSAELERASVAGRQQLRLTGCAPAPNGPDSVNDVFRMQQSPSARDLRVTSRAATMQATLLEELWTGGPMDGTVDASTSQETRVSGIHDCIGIRVRRDVAKVQRDGRHRANVATPTTIEPKPERQLARTMAASDGVSSVTPSP